MIYGAINSSDKFSSYLPESVKQLLFKLGNGEFTALGQGRHEYDGEIIYISADNYTTQPASERKYEFHRRYADLQVVLEGEELIYLSDSSILNLQIEAAANSNDCWFVENIPDQSSLLLSAGTFLLILPETLHKPCCQTGKPGKVKKLVFKIDRDVFCNH